MRILSFTGIEDLRDGALDKITRNTKPTFGILQNNKMMVYYRMEDQVCLDYCKEHNIPTYHIPSMAGPIVANVDDLALMLWLPGRQDKGWGKHLLSHLQHYLTKKGLIINLESNDMLLNWAKVAGYSERQFPQGTGCVAFIAMRNSQDIVNTICLKHRDKVTDGLLAYGITISEVREQVTIATQEYLKLMGFEEEVEL